MISAKFRDQRNSRNAAQAVSNLPISARLPLADLNGKKTAASCRGKPSAGWPLVMCYWRPVEIFPKSGD